VLGTNATGYGTASVRDAASNISSGTVTLGASGTVRVDGRERRARLGFESRDRTERRREPDHPEWRVVSVASAGTVNVGSTPSGHGDITVTAPDRRSTVGTINLGQTNFLPGGTAALTVTNGGVVNITNPSIFSRNAFVTIDGRHRERAGRSHPLLLHRHLRRGHQCRSKRTLSLSAGQVVLHSPSAKLIGGTISLSTNSTITGGGQITGGITSAVGSEISVGPAEQLLIIAYGSANEQPWR
jgi:hypothetical protein